MLRCDACCDALNERFGYPRRSQGFRGAIAGFAKTVWPVLGTCEICRTENVTCHGRPSHDAVVVGGEGRSLHYGTYLKR